jgi:hypothetical protein
LKIDIHKNYEGIYRVVDSFKVQILEDNSIDSNQEEDPDSREQSRADSVVRISEVEEASG